jgi:hypothetical protein
LRKVDGWSVEVGLMIRRSAAVLGLLGFAAILVRGIVAGAAWESTIGYAIAVLFAYTLVGGLAGWAAEIIVDNAIRTRLNTPLTLGNAQQSVDPLSRFGIERIQ